jgi:AraC-like DNA-binding protein
MRGITENLRQTHMIGDDTLERIVAASACPPLQRTRIRFTGLTDAGRGYLMVRVKPGFEQLTVCLGGEGRVLIDDEWRPCRAGQAYLMPPLATHAFRTAGRARWQFCWIIYGEPKPDERPAIGGKGPRLIDVDPRGLWSGIEGLYREQNGPAQRDLLDCYVALIRAHAGRVLDPYHERDPLWHLWAAVTADLSARWSLERLAEHACVSTEHLRRLCRQHLNRTPVHHVTCLRMARAAVLLESTPLKVDAVARAVGYGSPFAFSAAFHRTMGVPPRSWRTACNGVKVE